MNLHLAALSSRHSSRRTGLMQWLAYALPLAIACAAEGAFAQWQGHASGRIHTIEVTHISNYPFRVWLVGSPPLCNAGHQWAYLDGSGTNYKVFVATLLAAKARGASVSLYSLHDASGQNYCRIEHISTAD